MATPYNVDYVPPGQTYQSYQQLGSHAVQVEGTAASTSLPGGSRGGEAEAAGQRVSRYETSMNLRPDAEAGLAYVLGCITGVGLLILEKQNDYVRFHAWQSCLLSIAGFVCILVLAMVSHTLSWIAFITLVGILGYMSRRAYKDAPTFYRFELPYIGRLAADWVDSE